MRPDAQTVMAGQSGVSSRIRALAEAGYTRAEIAKLVDRSYQQVRQVLVDEERRRARSGKREPFAEGMHEQASPFLGPPLKLGTMERILLDHEGRLVLTPALIAALNTRPGEYVIAVAGPNGTVALTSARTAMEQAQALIRAHLPEGMNVVDEFLAERRAEAERENPEVIEAVADASALLAYFAREPGRDGLLEVGVLRICAVNHAEIVGRLFEWGLDDVSVEAGFRSLAYRVEPFDSYRAEVTGRLRRDPLARRLSLGDRACLSLALQTGLPVLTADRAWTELEIGVDVRLIR